MEIFWSLNFTRLEYLLLFGHLMLRSEFLIDSSSSLVYSDASSSVVVECDSDPIML